MSSVSSTNPGVAALLQSLSASSPVLSSALSSPQVQAALEKASPDDVVALSEDAVKLQQIGILFGATTTPSTTSTLDPLSQALEATLGVAPGSASSATPASAANTGQASGLAALFNSTATANPTVDALA